MKSVLIKKVCLGWIAVFFFFPGKAQEIPIQLTLEKAIEITLDANPSIKVANREIEKKNYAKKEVLGGLFPKIDASGQYTHTIKKQVFAFQDMQVEVGTSNQWTGGFTASLPLIAPTLWRSINLTERDVELAIESSRASKIDAVNLVKNAFYTVLLARDSYNVYKRSYDNAKENYENIKHKYENGLVAEYDMIRANVRVKSIEPNMIQAENGVNLSLMQLKVLMGIDIATNINPMGELANYEMGMYGELLRQDTALTDNSDLKQFDIQKKILNENLKLQKAEFLPTLAVTGLYQWVALNEDFSITKNDYSPFSTVGLSLSIPIFSGGSKVNKIKQTKISLAQMEMQRTDLIRNLQLAVRNYADAITKSVEAAAAAKEGVSEAEKGYQIALKMYDTGMGTMLDVNDADLARINAGLQYNQAIFDYLSAKSNLEKVLGREN